MVSARARALAMARVGGPAAGRGARRRRDLLRSSASRGAVTWKPLRPVKVLGVPSIGGAKRAGGLTDTQTDKRILGSTRKFVSFLNRFALALFSRWRLISEASLFIPPGLL